MRGVGVFVAIVTFVALSGCARNSADEREAGRGNWSGTFTLDGTPSAEGAHLLTTFEMTGHTVPFAPIARNRAVTTWRSEEGDTISLRNGLVVSTQAFTPDLLSVDATSPTQLIGASGHVDTVRIHRYSDGSDRDILRGYRCEIAIRSSTTDATTRIDETCFNATQDFTNTYWLDGAQHVVRSRQWLGDDVGYIRLIHGGRDAKRQ